MIKKILNLSFKKTSNNDPLPYDLLLLADPSKDMIDDYLKTSEVYITCQNKEILGIIVLFPLTDVDVEIKNIAVQPAFQGQGIGRYMIDNIVSIATLSNKNSICIGTANSSVKQLFLYQKLGFEITNIKQDFFIQNYPEPIFENGIQAKHMIVLSQKLNVQK